MTERKLAAILSADVVGYSRLMAEDEEATVRILGDYREQVDLLVRQHRGRLVDFTGDNFLAEFPTALDSVQSAVEIQRVLAGRNAELPAERKMEFRIGIHLGDIRVEGERIFGDGVNIAARLESLAVAGGICISATVHEQVRNRLHVGYDDLGDQTVKNIPDQVHVYQVRLGDPERTAAPRVRRPLRQWVVVAGLAVAAVLAGVWWTLRPGPVTDAGPIRSIAVLPLENLSGDPEQEYFADGMTEALIGDLAKLGSIRVISRTSVLQYKGVRKSLPEIARELNVDAVVEGTVMRSGDRVRITAQLIDARTDEHLWADRYDRDLRDVLRLQSDVARAIARQIDLELTPQEEAGLAPTRATDPRAYEAYLRGRREWQAFTPASLFKAIDYFEDAIEIDPRYALAHASLAISYCFLSNPHSAMPGSDSMPLARDAALRALELDDRLGEAHAALAVVRYMWEWDWVEAEREFERAIALSPSDPFGHLWYGWLLFTVGRVDDSLSEGARAVELAPLDAVVRMAYGMLLGFNGRPDLGLPEVERAVELDPELGFSYRSLSAINAMLGREQASAEANLRALQYSGVTPERIEGVRRAHAESGMPGYHRAVLRGMQERAKNTYVSPFRLAGAHAKVGEIDLAFEWLERAYQQRDPGMVYLRVAIDPRMHADPRFHDLLRRIGFPES